MHGGKEIRRPEMNYFPIFHQVGMKRKVGDVLRRMRGSE